MTPEQVEEMVKGIEDGDPECAHSKLDDIWEQVLRAISRKEAEDPSACAFVALQALERVPTRWYA